MSIKQHKKKLCTKCGQVKRCRSFDRSEAGGLYEWCRSCAKEHHKKRTCMRCHHKKSLSSFDRLESGHPYGMCMRCINELQRKIAKHPEEAYKTKTYGPALSGPLSDLERVQGLAVRAIIRRRLEEGDTIEMAFAHAITETSDDNAKLVDSRLLNKYLGLYVRKDKG